MNVKKLPIARRTTTTCIFFSNDLVIKQVPTRSRTFLTTNYRTLNVLSGHMGFHSVYCPLASSVKKYILAEFEVLYAQLYNHKPLSDKHLSAPKAKLSDVDHAYCGSSIDWSNFLMTKECFQAINAYITEPDKSSGEAILNKNDYNHKMQMILDDRLPPNSSI